MVCQQGSKLGTGAQQPCGELHSLTLTALCAQHQPAHQSAYIMRTLHPVLSGRYGCELNRPVKPAQDQLY